MSLRKSISLRPQRYFLEVALLILLAMALGACGSHQPELVSNTNPDVTAFSLPNPASLPKSVSYEPGDRYLPSRSFSDTLPFNLVEIYNNYAFFSPNWSPTSCELAYCMFDYSLPGFNEAAEVNAGWAKYRDPGTGVWVGLADWDRNTWAWFPIPMDGRADVGSMDRFVGIDGRVLATVAVTGTAEFKLAWLVIGPSLPPTAVLTADPMEGDAPLTVTFDATGSYDLVGTIDGYRWDLDDEGKFPISPKESVQVKDFSTPGPHRVGLAVYNDQGYWGYTWVTIQVHSDWSIEEVNNYAYPGHYSSLELDSAGHPHIASYMAGGEEELWGLQYTCYDGAAWQVEYISMDEDIGSYTSMVLDSEDHPHIACYDYVNECLKYYHHDGTEWLSETVDDVDQAGELGTSIRINALGQPCISYRGNHALRYAHHDGAGWACEIVDDDEWPGTMSSLALGNSDYPHIAYRGSLGLRYAYFDGSIWHTEHVDESAGGGDREISLALDGAGHPHIAYGDSTLKIFKYAQYDGSDWTLAVVDDALNSGIDCSLALDSLGCPHIAYFCLVDMDGDLKYANYNGGTWQVGLIADTGKVGSTPSLEFNGLDQPRVSFVDATRQCLMYMWIGDH